MAFIEDSSLLLELALVLLEGSYPVKTH